MQAMVWTESAGSTKWQATVDRIDRIADTNSGTYGVRLSINNPDQLIPVGLRCRVHFLPETVAAGPLRADGVDVRVLKRSGQKMVGFKIVSPPQYSGADLKAYLNRLRNAGMNDFIPLSKKQGARRIALGVYHSRRPAEERVKELEAKGFEVEIGPWYRQKEMHWLMVKGDTPLLDPQVAHKLAIVDGENPAQGSATGLPVASRRNCAPVWSRTP